MMWQALEKTLVRGLLDMKKQGSRWGEIRYVLLLKDMTGAYYFTMDKSGGPEWEKAWKELDIFWKTANCVDERDKKIMAYVLEMKETLEGSATPAGEKSGKSGATEDTKKKSGPQITQIDTDGKDKRGKE